MKSPMSFIAATLVAATTAVAETNALWFVVCTNFPTGKRTFSAMEIPDLIEQESVKVDARHRGLRLVRPPRSVYTNHFETMTVSVSPPHRFIDLMLFSVDGPLGCVISDDTALITWWNFRYVLFTIHGRCIDATTRRPIRNFTVTSPQSPLDVVLAVNPDGSYVCGIPYRLDFAVNCDTFTLPKETMWNGIQEIQITASGYAQRVYTKPLFENGKTGYRFLDIELQPIKKE